MIKKVTTISWSKVSSKITTTMCVIAVAKAPDGERRPFTGLRRGVT